MLFSHYIFYSFIICSALTFLSFLFFIIFRKHSIIDIFWAINIVSVILLLSSEHLFTSTYNSIISILLILWALRLSTHIFLFKIIKKKKDRRYTKMIKSSELLSMAKQFSIQIFFQVIVSLSGFFFTQGNVTVSLSNVQFYLVTTVATLSIFGESIADIQLQNHRKVYTSICTTGLWKYSRHPNYFFDVLFWFAIVFFSFGSHSFYFSLIGAMFLFITIFFITGPYTERCSIEKRGDEYKNYQKRTPYFFPFRF